MRGLVVLLIALAIFVPLNFVTIRTLLRLHPRGRKLIIAAAAAGNLCWFLLPYIFSVNSHLSRLLRALFGPPWFAWLLFTLVYSLFLVVAVACWSVRRRRYTFADVAREPSIIALVAVAFVAVAGAYCALVPLEIVPQKIVLADLPAELHGFRIALLSDLHVGEFTRRSRLRAIGEAVTRLQPDVIMISGDFLDDDPEYVPKFLELVSAMPARSPLLVVLGNHEMYGAPQEVIRRLRNTAVRLLVNEGIAIRRGEGLLWVAGLSDYGATTRSETLRHLLPDVRRALDGKPAAAFPIVLAHQPKAFSDAIANGVALTLCGHTHGGQFGSRRFGWTLADVFLDRHMGLYRSGNFQMYINVGTGYWLVPSRFGLPPEITDITLARESR